MGNRASPLTDELPVIASTAELLLWTIGRIEKFPRSHRFSLGVRLQNALHDVLDLLIAARLSADKTDLLTQCSIRLEQIRLCFRLACELRILAFNSHEFACRRLMEIGRQVSGWKRQQERKPS